MKAVSFYTVSATSRSGIIVIAKTLFVAWMIIVNLMLSDGRICEPCRSYRGRFI
ncbi:hypothetical protein PITC_066640 [Penicillium italicum]|uniref:Uncharacterized protein n=1 Tax=Penicillium italicum TaxID=40296 RepID=A0A0A2KKG2_PENIT|nr:hypothetical protein PITC_066640 [Penicillium italicum]